MGIAEGLPAGQQRELLATLVGALAGICRPLWDPEGILTGLKARVAADGLWSTEFALRHAEVHAARRDVYNSAGDVKSLWREACGLAGDLYAGSVW